MHSSQKHSENSPAPASRPAAAAVKAPARNSLRLRYASNPYRNTMRALGVTFQANPLSTLTITPLLLVVALIAFVPGALVMGLVSEPIGAVMIALGAAIWLTIAIAAILAVQSSSYHGKSITGKAALKALPASRLPGLFGLMLLSAIAIGIGFLLLVIPGLFIMARLALAQYAYYDEELGAFAALKRSWNLTRGHVWEILGTHVAEALTVGSSGGLLTFVGSSAGLADRYYTLRAHEKAGVATGPVHYSNYLSVILVVLVVVGYAGVMAVVGNKMEDAVTQQTELTTDNPFSNDDPFGTDSFEEAYPDADMQ